jgi:hypothetical protein
LGRFRSDRFQPKHCISNPSYVETVPGLADLIKFEEAMKRGEDPVPNLRQFVLDESEFVDWGLPDGDDPTPPPATEP